MPYSPCSWWATGLGPWLRLLQHPPQLQKGSESNEAAMTSFIALLCALAEATHTHERSFLRATEFHHTLRVCNAYPGREAPLNLVLYSLFQCTLKSSPKNLHEIVYLS